MEEGRENAEIIKNIWFPQQEEIECLCPKAISKLRENKNISQCYRCKKSFHSDCYWPPKEDELFECPFCYLECCFPNKRVDCILFGGFLPIVKRKTIQYKIDFVFDPKTNMDPRTYLEARSIKFNEANRYEISWPDKSELQLNNNKIEAFEPLPKNSSFKRRADKPVRLDLKLLKEDNELLIVEESVSESKSKIDKKCHYFVAIMNICELSRAEIIDRFVNSNCNTLPAEEYKQEIQQHLKSVNGVAINKMLISLKCPIYGNQISIPIRSRLCNKHLQPFDMSNFISYSILSSGAAKQWKCPICGKRSYDLLIDIYVRNLLIEHSNIKEIVFGQGFDHEIVEGSESEDGSSLNESRYNEIKQIKKRRKRLKGSAEKIELESNLEPFESANEKLGTLDRKSEKILRHKPFIKEKIPKQTNLPKKKNKTTKKQISKVPFPIQKFIETIEISSDEEDPSPFARRLRNRKKYQINKRSSNIEKSKLVEGNKVHETIVNIPQEYSEISSAQGRIEDQSTVLVNSKRMREKEKCLEENDQFPKEIIVIDLDSESFNNEAVDPINELKWNLDLHANNISQQTKVDIDSEDLSTFEEILNKVMTVPKKIFLYEFD